MKQPVFIIIGLLLICSLTLNAQDKKLGDGGTDTDHGNDFGIPMDDLNLTMDDINDIFGDSDDTNSWRLPYKGFLEDRNREEFAIYKSIFKNKFQKYNEYITNLDNYSPYTKCFYLMVRYINELEAVKAETANDNDCRRTYDLYGMQLTMMMSSTTIMFCTEELFNAMSSVNHLEYSGVEILDKPEELKRFVEEMNAVIQLVPDMNRESKTDFDKRMEKYTEFERTLIVFFQVYPELRNEDKFRLYQLNALLEKYFHPLSLMKDGVAISQQMDRLKPCTGY
ncbi:hypothetical protein D2V93_02140 [Flagellimonas taeanensis]|uniref:hypothetical protein n=1 Tax=Flavobacteriaceae TaxID=49546 RepID=UPI000E67E17C|nr:MULTISPECIES: hypothetical protein [Allomuricauda]MDC6384647.1 hypothetical protein [Muricauda sp. SK9]RIV53605.1 hypothetical protein D2V93_02140 [Allomuricauda taeanensis]